MGLDLRLPNITGATEKEQLQQIKSYLYQLAQQLQYSDISTNSGTYTEVSSVQYFPQASQPSSSGQGSSQAAFDELRDLIIKTANVVENNYEEITKTLKSNYVAQSAFGEYQNQVSNEMKATAEQVELNISDIEKIGERTDVVYSNMKFGKLGDDIYGIEIGEYKTEDGSEKSERTYARFTSKKLSFYDEYFNEVAYISDQRIHINNAEISNSLKIGGFLEEAQAGTNDVVVRWVGNISKEE